VVTLIIKIKLVWSIAFFQLFDKFVDSVVKNLAFSPIDTIYFIDFGDDLVVLSSKILFMVFEKLDPLVQLLFKPVDFLRLLHHFFCHVRDFFFDNIVLSFHIGDYFIEEPLIVSLICLHVLQPRLHLSHSSLQNLIHLLFLDFEIVGHFFTELSFDFFLHLFEFGCHLLLWIDEFLTHVFEIGLDFIVEMADPLWQCVELAFPAFVLVQKPGSFGISFAIRNES